MRIRRRPPPALLSPPILPLPDPPPSLYVDLLLPISPPPSPQPTISTSLPFLSPHLQLPLSHPPPPPPPLLHHIQDPAAAAPSRRSPFSQSLAAASSRNALEECSDITVSIQPLCEEISKPSTLFPSTIHCRFAEACDNNETRMPIRKRRSFTRPPCTEVGHVGTDGEFQDKRSVTLEELNQIATWETKDLLSWALKLIVPGDGSQVVARRIAENCYRNGSNTDSIPRLVQVGRAWRCNPHIQELPENILHFQKPATGEALMESGTWDHDMHDDRHNIQKQENKVSLDLNVFVDEKMKKREILDEPDEGFGSRIAAPRIEVGLKGVPTKCIREEGTIEWQLERRGQEGDMLCGHPNVEPGDFASDGEAKSSEGMIKMKRKKRKKRRCFRSLHEIVKRDEGRQLLQRQESAHRQYSDHHREKLSGRWVTAVASDDGIWSGSSSFQAKCALNTDPTEWRSDLF